AARVEFGLDLRHVPSSVVHTGVKSFGCENSTVQLLPIQSWKRILPSVVSASKSGAISLIASVMVLLLRVDAGQRSRSRGRPLAACGDHQHPESRSHAARMSSWTDRHIRTDLCAMDQEARTTALQSSD